jgi:hypothetical protein
MTTVDITLQNGRSKSRPHKLYITSYISLQLNYLNIIKENISAYGESFLIEAERRLNG